MAFRNDIKAFYCRRVSHDLECKKSRVKTRKKQLKPRKMRRGIALTQAEEAGAERRGK